MSNDAAWVVKWLANRGSELMPTQRQRAFPDQRSAVNFAMSLDAHRSSIELHAPGGQIENSAGIEQVHKAQKLADDKR
jgi:hypothetical protein